MIYKVMTVLTLLIGSE